MDNAGQQWIECEREKEMGRGAGLDRGEEGDQMAEAMDGQCVSEWLMEGRLTRCREVEVLLLSLFIIHHIVIGWIFSGC